MTFEIGTLNQCNFIRYLLPNFIQIIRKDRTVTEGQNSA